MLKVPTAQGTQVVCGGSGVLPAAHGLQIGLEAAEIEPAGHAAQAACVPPALYKPAGHATHAVRAGFGTVPPEQGVQYMLAAEDH